MDQTNWPSYITVSDCYSALCLLWMYTVKGCRCVPRAGLSYTHGVVKQTADRMKFALAASMRNLEGCLEVRPCLLVLWNVKAPWNNQIFFFSRSLHGYRSRDSISSFTLTLGETATALSHSLCPTHRAMGQGPTLNGVFRTADNKSHTVCLKSPLLLCQWKYLMPVPTCTYCG